MDRSCVILIDQFNWHSELFLGIIHPIPYIQSIAGSTSQLSSYKGTIFWWNIFFVGPILKSYQKMSWFFKQKLQLTSYIHWYSLELFTSFRSFTPFPFWERSFYSSAVRGASLSFLTFRYTRLVSSFSSSLNSSLLRLPSRIIQNGASHSLPSEMFRAQSKGICSFAVYGSMYSNVISSTTKIPKT